MLTTGILQWVNLAISGLATLIGTVWLMVLS